MAEGCKTQAHSLVGDSSEQRMSLHGEGSEGRGWSSQRCRGGWGPRLRLEEQPGSWGVGEEGERRVRGGEEEGKRRGRGEGKEGERRGSICMKAAPTPAEHATPGLQVSCGR